MTTTATMMMTTARESGGEAAAAAADDKEKRMCKRHLMHSMKQQRSSTNDSSANQMENFVDISISEQLKRFKMMHLERRKSDATITQVIRNNSPANRLGERINRTSRKSDDANINDIHLFNDASNDGYFEKTMTKRKDVVYERLSFDASMSKQFQQQQQQQQGVKRMTRQSPPNYSCNYLIVFIAN